jgi:diguanylate cyclase (GGDEF)-like protein/PAS domain S-box-containing protein
MTARILVVEDERIVALDLTATLRHLGYEVVGMAASAADAMRLARAHRPDLVLMDIHLEGVGDGTEAGAKILGELAIPVIYLTAFAEPDTLARAEASQPYGYLLKPFDLRELEACLRMSLARRRAELATESSEQRLRLALDAARLGVWEWWPHDGLVHVDGHFDHIIGGRPRPLVEQCEALLARVVPADRSGLARSLKEGEVNTVLRMHDDDARVRWVELYARSLPGASGHPDRVVGVVRDVTERLQNEQRLRQASAVFQTMAEGIAILDERGAIQSVNPAFCAITGHEATEVLGRSPDDFLHQRRHSADFFKRLAGTPEGYWKGEIEMCRLDGSVFPAWQHVCVVRDESGQVTHHVLTFSDIGQIRAAEAHIHHLAFHDALTGLGNRYLLSQRLADEIRRAGRSGHRLALLFIDLDNFKLINDTHGHAAGDELINAVAQRITTHLRASDLAVRLGGDEFVILVPDLSRIEDAALVAQKLLDELSEPVALRGDMLRVGASIGIAIHPDNGDSSEALMQAADSAMYGAKERGRHRYAFFSEDMARSARERLAVEQGLRRALEHAELRLFYQPVVAMASGLVTGVEALVRWQHPAWGMVGPQRFIQIAEDCGLIVPLGHWVLREACTQGAAWLARGVAPLRLAVNVSARQMQQADFADDVADVLHTSGFPPHLLELEITESTLQSVAESRQMLGRLKALGVAVAIDDFGTGFSSLSLLKHLAIDRIKLDRSFVQDLPDDLVNAQVTRAIVELARTMHLALTAEGIETEAQRSALLGMGCQEGQGYLFSRPLAPGLLEPMLRAGGPLGVLKPG